MAVQVATDADFKQLLESNEKVVVKYFAGWCGSCKLFAPKFRRLSEDDRFEGVTFLDVNAEENEEARKMANVNNLPYFAVFQNGALLNSAATSKEEMVVDLITQVKEA